MAIELAYINTKHPDFQSNASLVSSLLGEEEKSRSIPVRRSHGNAPSTYEQEIREQAKVRKVIEVNKWKYQSLLDVLFLTYIITDLHVHYDANMYFSFIR